MLGGLAVHELCRRSRMSAGSRLIPTVRVSSEARAVQSADVDVRWWADAATPGDARALLLEGIRRPND